MAGPRRCPPLTHLPFASRGIPSAVHVLSCGLRLPARTSPLPQSLLVLLLFLLFIPTVEETAAGEAAAPQLVPPLNNIDALP